ncbi:NPC intracellular cholesterol transporter 2-like [Panonychus citri]|uniref:NPC intracellular cholesterol transporter 2-like n=1 Tax=Panonychus citri TaxID=50023 RepID=UPI0023071E5D|nr:NPC intracellular cholesterol transporter 2-like [Panonychus citri]
MFKSVLIVFSFLVIGQLSPSWATIIRDCNSETGKLISLSVTGCSFNEDSDKCVLNKGETSTLVATFQNFNQTSQANLKIFGILMKRIPVPFIIEPNACASWGVHCPLSANSQSTMTISLPIKDEYPAIPVDIQVSLLDDKKKTIFCLQFAAQIEKK